MLDLWLILDPWLTEPTRVNSLSFHPLCTKVSQCWFGGNSDELSDACFPSVNIMAVMYGRSTAVSGSTAASCLNLLSVQGNDRRTVVLPNRGTSASHFLSDHHTASDSNSIVISSCSHVINVFLTSCCLDSPVGLGSLAAEPNQRWHSRTVFFWLSFRSRIHWGCL